MDPYQSAGMHHPMSQMHPTYPPPEATHQQVCDDYSLFKATLDRLLSAMGIKLKIPKIGGQEVDLHRLYKEVTNLGGLDVVISRKQWVTVCEPFNFPASFTNKSFVIKKLYINALHHYEQVYFRRNLGPVVPAPSNSAEPPLVLGSNHYDRMKRKHEGSMWGGGYPPQGPTTGFFRQQTHSANSHFVPSNSSHLPPGTRFSGTVDSSFEHGYYLTLELADGQRVQGMMYRRPSAQHTSHSQHFRADSAVVTGSEHMCSDSAVPGAAEFNSQMHRGQQQHHHNLHQHAGSHGGAVVATRPDGPKRLKSNPVEPPNQPRSALFFFASGLSSEEVRAIHPDGDLTQATVKVAAEKWNAMSMEQKQPYLDKANTDQLRYQAESTRLSQAVASGCSLRLSKDSSVSDECMEGRAHCPTERSAKTECEPGGSTPHSRHTAKTSSHYDHLLSSREQVHGTPRYPPSRVGNNHSVIPPLPPSHPMATALSAAHERAVKAAIAAGAPLPPPPHMLGIPLAPNSHNPEGPFEDFGYGRCEHSSYFNHQNYYSSESELCNQHIYQPEANSSGPSPAVEHPRYSEEDTLHGPSPCMDHHFDHHEDDNALLQHILGDHTGDGKPLRLTQDLNHDPTDEAFARMLEAGPLFGNDHPELMDLAPSGIFPAKGQAAEGNNTAGKACHQPDSSLSEHEQSYPDDFDHDDYMVGAEGYPSSVFATGPAGGYEL